MHPSKSPLSKYSHRIAPHRTLLKNCFLLCILVVVSIPIMRLLWIYGNTFFNSHLLEVNDEARLVKRYSASKNTANTKDFFNQNYLHKKPLGEMQEESFDLESYYTLVYQQYQSLESKKSMDSFYRNALDLEDLKASVSTINNPGFNDEIQTAHTYSKKSPPNAVGKEDAALLGDMKDLQLFHHFDDTNPAQEKDPNLQKSENDKVARQLDQDSHTEDIRLDKHVQSREDAYKSYSKTIRQKTKKEKKPYHFYTSPIPAYTKKNTTNELSQMNLILSKDSYYAYELVHVNLISPNSINLNDLKIYVKRSNYLFPNVGGKNDFFFKYKKNTIYTKIAMGYSPSPGQYTILVRSKSNPKWKGIKKTFSMRRRKVPPLKKGFSVVNLEYTIPLTKTLIQGPNGKIGRYDTLVEWLSYMDVDALWMLVAQTTGWDPSITPDSPWVKGGFTNLNLLGPVCKEKNIMLGAYVMSYFTPGNGKRKVGYDPSLGYSASVGLEDSLHISLNCSKRLNDIIKVVKQLDNNPHVSFIGLDFIRTGRADGYEMGPLVVEDMSIPVPDEYHSMKHIDKIKWFAAKVENRTNKSAIAKWRWWRAHKVATIANTIIHQASLKKPMWVFTLGWEHGKQHGQDPYMFFDAGVLIDAIMLYEANTIQFKNMMIQWPNYMRNNLNNLVIGNASDIRFLDGSSYNTAIEYMSRTRRGYQNIYREGFAKGIFLHDLSRALWSSKRGINIKEWAIVHGHATSLYRFDMGLIPYKAEAVMNDDKKSGVIKITNNTDKHIQNMYLSFVQTAPWKSVTMNAPYTISLNAYEAKHYLFDADLLPDHQDKEVIIGFKVEHPYYRKFFFFTQYSKRDLNSFLVNVR